MRKPGMSRLSACLSGLALLAGGCLCLAGPATGEVRRAVLSIAGLDMPAGHGVRAFRIETFGVELLAVCRVPRSWALKSEMFEGMEGYISGRADTHGASLKALDGMYLVDVYEPQASPKGDDQSGQPPASFSGWVEIGFREAFDDPKGHVRRHRLRRSNFRLTDARSCPVPASQAP